MASFVNPLLQGREGRPCCIFTQNCTPIHTVVLWHKLETEPDSSWSLSHYLRVESWTGNLWGFQESWYSPEALCSLWLWLQRLSEDISGVQQWWDWFVTEWQRHAHMIVQDLGGPQDHDTLLTWGNRFWETNLMFNVFHLAEGWEHQIPRNCHVRSVWSYLLQFKVLTESSLSSAAEHILHIWGGCQTVTLSPAASMKCELRSNLLYAPEQDLFFNGAADFYPSIKVWVGCSATSKACAFSCSLAVYSFFVVLLHGKWSCFSFFSWKRDFFFC